MKLEVGQIISHCCRFPPEEEEEMDRHLVLSVDDEWLETYVLFTYWPSEEGGPHCVGGTRQTLVSTIDSEEDTPNNFYWKIIS